MSLNRDVTISYTGPYWDHEGKELQAENMALEFLEYEPADRSAGIMNDALYVCKPGAKEPLDEEDVLCVDPYEWETQVCEQTGGHNYVDHQWSEEPESACQICTRCGKEIDPA